MFNSLLPSRVGLALALAAFLIPVTVSWASTVVTYAGPGQTFSAGQAASNPTSASRDWDRVYRPAGNFFDLAYLNSNGTFQSAISSNAFSNPFVDPNGSAFFARAWCHNSSGGLVTNVTCQTTKP